MRPAGGFEAHLLVCLGLFGPASTTDLRVTVIKYYG
jgi:hypothetical protein